MLARIDAGNIQARLERENKHDFAYHKMKEWIINGDLPADTILVERQLCDMLGLSRTPVRSALQELAKDGYVLTAPGRGMMVSRVQIDDVIEIFEIRRSLDTLALELFMKSGRTEIVPQMRQTVDDMRTALEKNDYQAFGPRGQPVSRAVCPEYGEPAAGEDLRGSHRAGAAHHLPDGQ